MFVVPSGPTHGFKNNANTYEVISKNEVILKILPQNNLFQFSFELNDTWDLIFSQFPFTSYGLRKVLSQLGVDSCFSHPQEIAAG